MALIAGELGHPTDHSMTEGASELIAPEEGIERLGWGVS
jgi:hypothetical protein